MKKYKLGANIFNDCSLNACQQLHLGRAAEFANVKAEPTLVDVITFLGLKFIFQLSQNLHLHVYIQIQNYTYENAHGNFSQYV